MNNRLYSIREAANILGVSTKTLRRWDQRGRFVPTRTIGNQRRYTREQIDELRVERGKLKVGTAQVPPLFSETETPKEIKVTHALPSALSGLPSGSFLRNHFLLKHASVINESISSSENPKESSEPAGSHPAKLSPFKVGFVVASLVLIFSLAGAGVLTKYNVIAGLSEFAGQLGEKKEQLAKFISDLPLLHKGLEVQDQTLSFVPPDLVGAVLAAATGGSDLVLNINIPTLFSQSVGIGIATPDASAILDLVSEEKGILPPRMTQAQIEAIPAPAAGLFIYNTDTNHYNMYNGTSWQGVFSSIGDSTIGEAFTEKGTSGTALYFYDADGRGKLVTANLSAARTYTFPDATGEISLLGQTISNSELVNNKVTVSPGTNMTGGGDVALGSSITLTLKDSISLAGTLTVSGTSTLTGATAITGALTANGNVTLGDAATDTITFTGRVAQDSDLIPITTTGTSDLGTSALPWDNLYVDNISVGASGTSAFWQRNSNSLSPRNITDDFLLGATATSSALIKLTGTNVAGANSSWFNAGNVGIGDTSPAALFVVGDGDDFQIDSTGDITLNQTTPNIAIGNTGTLTITDGTNTLFSIADDTSEGDVTVTGDLAVNGATSADITSTTTTGTLFNATVTTLSLGGAATTLLDIGNGSGNYTAINLGSGAGTHTINIAGTGATGADTINIGTGGTGADTITIGNNASTTSLALTSGTGSQTFTSSVATGTAFSFVSNSITSGNALTLSSTGTTTGEILDLTGTWAPTDGSTNEAIDLNITHTPTTALDNFRSIDLDTSDGTALGNTIYNYDGTLTLTGNAAKTGYGIYQTVTSNSTTADTIYSLYGASSVTGAISSGTRNTYGAYSNPAQSGANSGGTANLYGAYINPSSTASTTGSTVNVYGAYVTNTGTLTTGGTINSYGVYVANGTSDTVGTSAKYGIYIEDVASADTNIDLAFSASPTITIGNTGTLTLTDGTNTLFSIADDTSEGDVTVTGDLAVNGATSADITSSTTTGTLFNATVTTLSLGGAATTALNIGNGNTAYTAINIGSGTGGNTINIAGTGATGADTINIGTGATGADTITIGTTASTTSLAFTSGTGSQTFTSSVISGTTTTSAFVFANTNLTSGTLIYSTSSVLTSGMLANLTLTGSSAVASAANSGSLMTLTSTTTGFTGATQRLAGIFASGANTNASAVVQGLAISVTNTGTTNTNTALLLTASGASTANNAIDITAGLLKQSDATDSTSVSTGSINTAGGIGIAKDVVIGGGDLISTATTFNLANTTATTLNLGGAATTLTIGAAASTTTLTGQALTFTGANTTNNTTLLVRNTSNTAATAEHAIVDIAVGGTTTTGDPQLRLTIPSGTSYYIGADNSNSDVLDIGTGTTVGSTRLLTLAGAGGSTVFNDDSADIDFRIESDTNANFAMFDAGLGGGVGHVGFGVAAGAAYQFLIGWPAETVSTGAEFQRFDLSWDGAITVNTVTLSTLVSANFNEPNITIGTGAVTTAANIFINGIPTEGSNNYGLWASMTGTTGTIARLENTTNTAVAAHSIVDIAVGGTTSTGDPQMRLTVPGGTSWYAGVDNSDSDKFEIGTGTAVGTTTALTIDTSSNVGIGTAAPLSKTQIDLAGVTGASKALLSTFGSGGRIVLNNTAGGSTDSEVGIFGTTAGNGNGLASGIGFAREDGANWGMQLRFYVRPTATVSTDTITEAMRITAAGNVGIGTTSPVALLDVGDYANDATQVGIRGAKTYSSGIPLTQLNVQDSTSMAAGVGGAIAFSGSYTGTSPTTFGSIEGVKANGTDANYAGELRFFTRINGGSNTQKMVIDTSGNVGIGTTSPQSALSFAATNHIGLGTTDGSDTSYLSIGGGGVAGETRGGTIYLSGDDRATFGGRIDIDAGDVNSSGVISFRTGGNNRVLIDYSGNVFINDTSNANMTLGLTINQGTATNHILTFKASDVNHGMTSGSYITSEVDDYGIFSKYNATSGGFRIDSINENTADAVTFGVYTTGGTANTTKSTAGRGLVEFTAAQQNGANAFANVAANGGLFAIRGQTGGTQATEWLVDVEGDTWQNGTITAGSFPSTGTAALCWDNAGESVINDCSGTPVADYMEFYSVEAGVETGDIVVSGTTSVVTKDGETVSKLAKTTQPYQATIIGIVSDPAKAGDFNSIGRNIKDTDNPMPVALSGRVPVKVTSENGNIAVGDPITSSSVAGVGMKATKAGRVIGIALEAYTSADPAAVGKVMVFINPHWMGTDKLLALDGNNNLGIGTTSPSFRLDIQDMQIATAAARIFNTDTGTGSAALVLKLGNTSTDAVASTNHFLSFETAGIGIVGSVSGNGGKGVTYATSGVADFAEYFRKDSNQTIEFGSSVCLGNDGLAVPCDSNNNKIIGVASKAPAFLGGENLGNRSIAVGLVGQVETLVSNTNGEIKAGDPLTVSDIPGVAVKATKPGAIIGKALQGFAGTVQGKILVSVNISWHDPSIYIASDGTLGGIAVPVPSQTELASQGQALEPQAASASASLAAQTNYILENDSLFKDLKDKVLSLQSKLDLLSLQFEQQASISGQVLGVTLNATGVTSDATTASTASNAASASAALALGDVELNNATISDSLMVLGRTTVTDLGVTGNMSAGLLAIHGLTGEINTLTGDLRLQSNGLGGVNILNGLIVIDTKGNMTVAGTITADGVEASKYTVVGQQSIGSSAIPAGETSIEISTGIATSSSKIFLTTTSLTDKQITVVEKSDGRFTVAIPQPTTSPISFDWWIVGNRN